MVKKAYEDAAQSKTRVYEWFSRFKNKEMTIEDKHRSGRPSTSRTDENVKQINALVREDRRRTIDQLCEMSGISWSSVQRILSEDLHMRRVAAKFLVFSHANKGSVDFEHVLSFKISSKKTRNFFPK
nr:unnamed protein product [Callosobruchus analis]